MMYRGSRAALLGSALLLISAGELASPELRNARDAHTAHSAADPPPAAPERVQLVPETFTGGADATSPQAPQPSSPTTLAPRVITERTRAVRGGYLSAPAIAMRDVDATARYLQRSGLNAAVIDFKDANGLITAPDADDAPATEKQPVTRQVLQRFDELGIYTIARIVCFSDPLQPRKTPQRAVLDGRPNKEGQIWADWGVRNTWLDPYHPDNQQMVIDLARRAQALGFSEVQLDYIRFPVDVATTFAVFPSQTEQSRTELLTDLLRRVDEAIDIPLGVDVFGTTAFRFEDQGALGQDPKAWKQHVQVFSPMLYMKGMSSYMAPGPRRAERLVRLAVSRMREEVGSDAVIRPFLQAFESGADYFTPDFITEQVRGAVGGSGQGYLFWHPGSNYGLVREAHKLAPLTRPPPRLSVAAAR